ncbi:MAG TPA: hypothetical protein VK034_06855 [Enhygromyxa sp.]|nr:hypothetical protein [Enhygromyxa sp.]
MHIHTLIMTAILLVEAPTQSHDDAIRAVDTLDQKINMGEPVRAELADALGQLPDHAPSIAADPEARAIVTRARLDLARSYLTEGDRDGAAAVIDDLLRSTIGEQLQVDEFGPSLATLYAERQAALAQMGTGTIEVRCRVACRVFINERVSAGRIDGAYFGSYRVWVEAEQDAGERVRQEITLSAAQPDVVVEFAPAPSPEVELPPAPMPKPVARIMPAPAEAALTVLGVGVAVAGVLLLATNEQRIPSRTSAGATLTALGSASLLLGGITLGIDEVRAGQARGRQATIGWRMQF